VVRLGTLDVILGGWWRTCAAIRGEERPSPEFAYSRRPESPAYAAARLRDAPAEIGREKMGAPYARRNLRQPARGLPYTPNRR
jgi:hypothetical protein